MLSAALEHNDVPKAQIETQSHPPMRRSKHDRTVPVFERRVGLWRSCRTMAFVSDYGVRVGLWRSLEIVNSLD